MPPQPTAGLDIAGAGDLPAGGGRAERAAGPGLQVPLHGGKRGGSEAGPGTPEHARRDRVQDSTRSAADGAGAVPAQVLDRRMAAVVERAAGRYVAGGSAAGRAERGGSISA